MKNYLKLFLLGAVLVLVASCAGLTTTSKEEARTDVLYTCNCGPECNCNSVSTHPGNCKCGKPMIWGHVLKIEGNEALVCTCKEGCTCKLDPNDPTKCGCGKKVKRVSLVGTGIYFCNCGGSCFCNTVSDKPGKCKCGMPLHKVDK
jgi:hypothetical protein